MTNSETLGIGLYSIVEASRLLETPRRTLSRWEEGYVQELRSGTIELLLRCSNAMSTRGYSLHLEILSSSCTCADSRDAGVGLEELRSTSARFRSDMANALSAGD